MVDRAEVKADELLVWSGLVLRSSVASSHCRGEKRDHNSNLESRLVSSHCNKIILTPSDQNGLVDLKQ